MTDSETSASGRRTVTIGEAELWCAWYEDFSDVALFGTELEALRYAIKSSMSVRKVKIGESLRGQLR
jgi:hypothetical protein